MQGSLEARPEIEPVRKQIVVPLSKVEAFRLFTEGIATWWPLAGHSVAGAEAVTCRFEPFAGGRLLEETSDGSIHVWGTVETWDPPHRIIMSWHPGRQEDVAQHLEVSFTSVDGGTQLDLVHTGWEVLGVSAEPLRNSYEAGWDPVLDRFSKAAGGPAL